MSVIIILFIVVGVAYLSEELILIKPVVTAGQSNPLCKWLLIAGFWVPFIALCILAITLNTFGGIRLGGIINGVGLLLCALAIGLRFWSRRTLGRFYTIGVVKQEGHQVIQNGPYRYVRHPACLALIILYSAFPLVIGSWLGFLILSLPAAIIFLWLIIAEDAYLAQVLGSEYQEYQRHSARLIPGVW